MNEAERERLASLLRGAMPLEHPELETDLWPRMLRTLDRKPRGAFWLDWVLLGAAVAWCAVFPGVVSVLLYQL